MNSGSSYKLLTLVVLLLLPIAGIIGFIVPSAPTVDHQAAVHTRMALTLLMTVAFSGSALLFLAGLGGFKSGLRIAYRWLASGIILFGLGMLQWPIIVLLDWFNTFWATSGLVILPFVGATALMYVGMRQFARLLDVHSRFTSLAVSMLVVFNFTLASGLAAHFFASNPTVGAQTYTATVAWSAGFGLLAWLLVGKTRKVIGQTYRRPMATLFFALGVLTFGGFHEYASSYFITEESPYIYWGISLWPFIIAALCMIWAGYAFSGLGRIEERQVAQKSKAGSSQTYIESIATIASLASRPDDIDVILDGLRDVSSSLGEQAELSVDQKKRLVIVYRQLETYLVTKDPLRLFTAEQLRSRISPDFRREIEGPA